ncbi:hypothetical protein ACOSQ3_023045 [Xanthoceras sorbifolium]
MIWRQNKYLSLGMLFFMKKFFPFILWFHQISSWTLFPDLVLPHSSLTEPATSEDFTVSSINTAVSITSDVSPHASADSSSPDIHSMLPPSELSTDSDDIPLANVRRSSRVVKPPTYLRDYHCNLITGTATSSKKIPYCISNHLSYDALSDSHKYLVLNISAQIEPQFYYQAVKDSQWKVAIQEELQAMKANHTWTVTFLPIGKHTIGCKWIYKIKYRSDGSIERHKARLVAKGYTQQKGLDFVETFSPVAKLVTVKVLLALAASHQWHLAQLDVNNAFLNSDLFEEVYMDLPLGYSK